MKTNLQILLKLSFGLVLGFSRQVSSESFFIEGKPAQVAELQKSEDLKHYPRFDLLAKVLSPSVVNISVEAAEEEIEEKALLPFLKPQPQQKGDVKSLGSGFIVSEDGYIATNNHVIDKAQRIIVRLLDDKTEYEAELIGKDEKTDLALLKIESDKSLPPVHIGDSDSLEVGEWVMAIGNQFQLGQTVTAGIVSAKSRRVQAKVSGPYDNFIQTDASINPGSSGGPLFNTEGQVIGINTAIFSPGRTQYGGTGFNIGIGFAIPINMARDVFEQLKTTGKVIRGMLGVIIQNIDKEMSQALGLKEAEGALVADIVPGSPAAKVGFKIKDVIIDYNGSKIEEHEDLPALVAKTKIGTKVKIKVLRNGETITLTPVIKELTAAAFTNAEEEQEELKPNEIGLALQNITKDLAASLKLAEAKGVIVAGVEPDSIAAKAGIGRSDIIEEFDGRPVLDVDSFALILKSVKKNVPILVLIRRKEGTRFLTLTIE